MSCGTCGIQASNTMQDDTGVPAGAPQTERPRCPHCRAFIRAGAACRNPKCPPRVRAEREPQQAPEALPASRRRLELAEPQPCADGDSCVRPRYGWNGLDVAVAACNLPRYFDCLSRLGFGTRHLPVPVSAAHIGQSVQHCSAVFLMDGYDVDPTCYGQERHRYTHIQSTDRDNVELALAQAAIAQGKPLLGVNRGLHILAVSLGGQLRQDIEESGGRPHYGKGSPHLVHIAPESRLARIMGTTTVVVSGDHHQAIDPDHLPPGWQAVAWAPDGVIEAIEPLDPDKPWLAVQWNVDEMDDAPAQAIRQWFATLQVAPAQAGD